MEHYVEDPLAEDLLRGNFRGVSAVHITLVGDKLAFKGVRSEDAPEEEPVAAAVDAAGEPQGDAEGEVESE